MNIAIIQEMLKEKHKLPDDFFWDRVGAVGGDSPDTELTGKRCPLIKSGPNKDRPNWYAGPAESWRTFIVTPEDVEAFHKSWIKKTGKCVGCFGTGEVWVSWHCAIGWKMKDCPDCSGSGSHTP